MPSMTAYSPYETLTLFQSIAKYGADASTFQGISSALTQNEHVRQSGTQNADRLSAKALRGHYDDLVNREKGTGSVRVNGDATDGERSPKRRKLSPSPQLSQNGDLTEERLVQSLVEKFYARYKAEVLTEIRRDEEAYAKLHDEIKSLELQIAAEAHKSSQPSDTTKDSRSRRSPTAEATSDTPTGSRIEKDRVSISGDEVGRGDAPVSVQASVQRDMDPASSSKPSLEILQTQAQGHSPKPGTTDGTVPHAQVVPSQPSPSSRHSQPTHRSPQHTAAGHLPATAGYGPGPAPGSQPPVQPPAHLPSTQQRNPTRQSPVQHHSPSVPSPAQHPYPPYPAYHPQWHPQLAQQHHPPPHHQQHPGYPHHYYPPPVPALHPQTPQQIPYQHYPHPAPIPYGPPPGWRGQPYGPYPNSVHSTPPVSRPASRVSVSRSGSTTPWRRKRDSNIRRPSSPTRPERAISPLVDRDSPWPETAKRLPRPDNNRRLSKVELDTPTVQSRGRRRGRPSSKTPSTMAPSRSRSNASRDSDTTLEKSSTVHSTAKIKAEAPGTPLPPPSDSETQRSSGRRGRPRDGTVTSHVDIGRAGTVKRKRESPSPSPAPRSPAKPSGLARNGHHHVTTGHHDPSLVVVSRNFSKTSQLLLNEITSHKLAGIFAKPLSERDAPGYKDLIHRPQDLKSIKAAIGRGNRAALTAIDDRDADHDATGSGSITGTNNGTVPGPLGNGFYLVKKTVDLMPPRAIVNSAQLEMELVRMFANAIMFNPLSSSESGFGRSFKLRRNGGDPVVNRANPSDPQDDRSDDAAGSEGRDTPGPGGAGWDEGGIIADTREMFDDVTEAVNKWRDLEVERMGTERPNDSSRTGSITTPGGAGGHLEVHLGRHTSVSASSNIADDDGGDGDGTPVPTSATGTARKKRRLGVDI